jgi:hypothetical protein
MEQIVRASHFQIEALEERIAPSPALVDVHNVKVEVKDINVGVNAAVLSNGQQTLKQN